MSAASESKGRRMASLSVVKTSGASITQLISLGGDPAYLILMEFTAVA
jgi:hypothetical protein